MRRYLASAAILATMLFASTACEDAPITRGDAAALDASSTTDASPPVDADVRDGSPISCDGTTCGPACTHLGNCCGEVPMPIADHPCETAAAGSETACQMVLDRAHGIDRCLDHPRQGDGGP